MIFRLVLTTSLILAAVTASYFQENVPPTLNFHRWGSITVFNGLPSDSVRAIAQTPDGILWFGTDNGLARFDGRRVQNFSLGEGDTNRILVMKTSASGELWIGTQKGAFVFSQNKSAPVAGTENIAVQSILLGGENLLGTSSGFVLRVTNNDGIYSTERLNSEALLDTDGKPLVITGLLQDSNRLLAATYGRGIFVYRDGRLSELASTPRPTFVNSLAKDDLGNIWIGTDAKKGVSGIFSLTASRADRIAAPTANVWPLEANSIGLWAGTARYGLFRLSGSAVSETFTFENTSGGLRSNTVLALFTDREGVVWIGTNRGVSRYDPFGPFQETVSNIPNSNFIRTIFQDASTHIFAGSNRGFFTDSPTWTEIPSLKNKVIYAISNTSPQSMVVGTAEGIFDLGGRKIADGDTRNFGYFQESTYAAIYGRGVVNIADSAQPVVFSESLVTSIYADTQKLWIGTAGKGLFSFDGSNVKSEAGPESLQSGTIWKITNGPDGRIWLAGEHGVFAFGNGQAERIVDAEDVRDLVIGTENDIWAATTTRGLLHARKFESYGWLVSAIGFEQGLPSEKAFSILPLRDGRLLIATNRGLVTYTFSRAAPKLIPIRVLSQRLHDLGELTSTIALDYPQNSILVEVAGLSSRTFPEEFQYAFVLKNSRGEIVDQKFSNDSQYNPTELKPGEYIIEATAFDRDLNASDLLQIKFSIEKAPFPWTATALGVLLAIALIGLIWAGFEHRRIRQRNRELAAARFDLANEAERERSRIARDLHDQTLADLRNLMMRTDKGAIGGPELREEIESVSTEIRRICEDLSPSVLENVGLVAALDFLLSRSIENHKFSANETVEERINFPLNVQLQIYRIAQEVLANIRRHSDADMVEMKVESPEDAQFLLIISDNGKLFQPDGAVGKGRGVANIRSRANLIGGKVAWKERGKGGNTFSLRISREL